MTTNGNRDFDFDSWAELAARDPDAFEHRRADAIAGLINSAPAHLENRMQGLQWHIDCARKQSETPMAACIRISRMMWDRVLGDNGLVENLEQLTSMDQYRKTATQANAATVLSFSKIREETEE